MKVCADTLLAAIKPTPAISPMAKMASGIPLTEQMARRTSGRVGRLESPDARATPGMKVWNGRRALVSSRLVGLCLSMSAMQLFMISCGANHCSYVLSHGRSFTFRAWADSPTVNQCEIPRPKSQSILKRSAGR